MQSGPQAMDVAACGWRSSWQLPAIVACHTLTACYNKRAHDLHWMLRVYWGMSHCRGSIGHALGYLALATSSLQANHVRVLASTRLLQVLMQSQNVFTNWVQQVAGQSVKKSYLCHRRCQRSERGIETEDERVAIGGTEKTK